MPGMIPSSSIVYMVSRPMLSRREISGTVMRLLGEYESTFNVCPESQFMSLSLGTDHPRAEWVFGLHATRFTGPFVLTAAALRDRSEAVVGDD
jgi:hypothetical protein